MNECCTGPSPLCTHDCIKNTISSGVCRNNFGGYDCITCSVSGEEEEEEEVGLTALTDCRDSVDWGLWHRDQPLLLAHQLLQLLQQAVALTASLPTYS